MIRRGGRKREDENMLHVFSQNSRWGWGNRYKEWNARETRDDRVGKKEEKG